MPVLTLNKILTNKKVVECAKELKFKSFENSNFTSELALEISKLKNLEALNFKISNLPPEFLKTIFNNENLKYTLKKLELTNWAEISEETADDISKIEVLELLDLSFCEINEENLDKILGSKKLQENLKSLNLTRTKSLTSKHVNKIVNFTKLKDLKLGQNYIHENSLIDILSDPDFQSNIENLEIYGIETEFGNDFDEPYIFKCLKNFESLKKLSITIMPANYKLIRSLSKDDKIISVLENIRLSIDNIRRVNYKKVNEIKDKFESKNVDFDTFYLSRENCYTSGEEDSYEESADESL
ncbi:hypothetical protein DMUE_3698 [Dictyocoela muelleri]|nr:hypothetical protein DMUE_3698 [Dictyocoela muelleri]